MYRLVINYIFELGLTNENIKNENNDEIYVMIIRDDNNNNNIRERERKRGNI